MTKNGLDTDQKQKGKSLKSVSASSACHCLFKIKEAVFFKTTSFNMISNDIT
jgi:hypothetical protein